MNEHMNPNYPKQRGCFIEENKNKEDPDFGKFKVVDYPTWTVKNGRWFPDANEPIPDTQKSEEKWFASRQDAVDFCNTENYVICSYPKSDAELAEIRAKREAYWASHGGEAAERDAFDDALDL